ncbi:hypothetical protein [Ruminococcus flavefaciens]|uniref:hypothetical protein n=1 Tax=Ruminococcus flavefaciens TaxID=1265 RepID=UPI0026EDC22C|nr:hypothetical protein [Ruminococcus flavefaciens]
MRNNRIPDNKEWEKIVDDAFSSDTQHDFSVMYELRKENIQKGITMKKTSNYIRRRYIGMVAAAAAVVIGAPVTVYALSNSKSSSTQLAEVETNDEIVTQTVITPEEIADTDEATKGVLQLEKNGQYQYILRYTPTDEEANNEQYYDVEYTFLPDGTYQREHDLKYKVGTGGGITPCKYRISAATPMIEKVGGIVKLDDLSNNEKTAYIFHRQDNMYLGAEDTNSFGRVAWIHFKGTNYILQLYFTDDISEDDVRSVIDGAKLVPSEEQTAGIWFNREESTDTNNAQPVTSGKSIDDFTVVSVGDTVKDEREDGNNIEITVNDAWVQDNFDGINTDGCGMPADYSEFLGEDGKIYETYQYGTIGDGINTIDEITDTVKTQKKVIVLDLTYKNVGDEDIYEDRENCKLGCNIFPSLIIAPQWDCNWRVKASNTDKMLLNHSKLACEDFLSLESDNKSGKNAINIPAGGETHVRISLAADADDVDDLYVDFTGHALYPNSSKNQDKSPILPVKDIK